MALPKLIAIGRGTECSTSGPKNQYLWQMIRLRRGTRAPYVQPRRDETLAVHDQPALRQGTGRRTGWSLDTAHIADIVIYSNVDSSLRTRNGPGRHP